MIYHYFCVEKIKSKRQQQAPTSFFITNSLAWGFSTKVGVFGEVEILPSQYVEEVVRDLGLKSIWVCVLLLRLKFGDENSLLDTKDLWRFIGGLRGELGEGLFGDSGDEPGFRLFVGPPPAAPGIWKANKVCRQT